MFGLIVLVLCFRCFGGKVWEGMVGEREYLGVEEVARLTKTLCGLRYIDPSPSDALPLRAWETCLYGYSACGRGDGVLC